MQQELDTFREYWNYHEIRKQPGKLMPSQHVPIDAFENPGKYGGTDCRIPVPPEMIAELRAKLEMEVGPRAAHLDFLTPEIRFRLDGVYTALDSPILDFDNCWEVFTRMVATASAGAL